MVALRPAAKMASIAPLQPIGEDLPCRDCFFGRSLRAFSLGLWRCLRRAELRGQSRRASNRGGGEVKHVFLIILENKTFSNTFGTSTQDPYLQKTLVRMGGLLTQYYGSSHVSLDNYISIIRGQGSGWLAPTVYETRHGSATVVSVVALRRGEQV
jgi:phospholipase C